VRLVHTWVGKSSHPRNSSATTKVTKILYYCFLLLPEFRFCSVFQVIQVISSSSFSRGKSLPQLQLRNEGTPQISKTSFWKRDREKVFLQMFNSGRNESTPQTQNNVSWISSKAELEIWRYGKSESLLKFWVLESGPKNSSATGVTVRGLSQCD